MEIFGPTVQGEGLVCGQQTLFIRFGGCDYRCTKCDSMHAVDPHSVSTNARRLTAEEICAEIEPIVTATGVRWVTFSGGNPCMHKLEELVYLLSQQLQLGIAVETQGTLWANWLMACDVVTLSPKGPGMGETFEPVKFDHFMAQLMGHPGLNVKIVIMDQRDIEFAASIVDRYPYLNQKPDSLYLSLGNPFPPKLNKDEPDGFDTLELIESHVILLEDILQDRRLRNARVLPQLHVYWWQNRKGV